MYDEHEKLLEDPNVDVVCIATPDAHHAPQAIDALNAKKDVYCEKPLTHWNQFELAKQIDAAAKKNNCLVQVGTQYMADDNYPAIRKMIEDGAIGKPVHAQCAYMRRGDWGERMPIPDPNAKPGPDLNWERFLGDSPKVPFSVSRFFQWRLYWDYAGGPATDLLVHSYTPVFAILGLDFPERVFGGGGTFQYNREVPDQCNIIADYPDGPSVILVNTLSNHVPMDTVIRGTEGIISWPMIGTQERRDPDRLVRQRQSQADRRHASLERHGRHGQALEELPGLREDARTAGLFDRYRPASSGSALDGRHFAPREQSRPIRLRQQSFV